MNDEKADQFKEDFLMYQRVLKEHPEIANALKENERLESEINGIKEQKIILTHEFKNYLNNILGIASILKEEIYQTKQEKEQALEIITKSAEIMNDLTEVLYLENLSKEEIIKKSEPLILEELTREHAIVRNKYMKDEKIGLHLKYNQLPYHKPLKMKANRAIMNSIWGTLFTNSLDWAPELSNITQAFRINKIGNLEIIMENEYAEKRIRQNGLGEGVGIPFVKKIIETMGGCFCTYETNSQIKKDYDMDEWWGYKKARDLKEDKKIFGVKAIIPYEKIGELSEKQ